MDALPEELLAVETRLRRRTALVELRGELDLFTAPQVSVAVDTLRPAPEGVRHIVLDLRGLTFIDVAGLHEILRQHRFAQRNAHNVAFVKGSACVERLLRLTAVDEQLVLVDDPGDLAPPTG